MQKYISRRGKHSREYVSTDHYTDRDGQEWVVLMLNKVSESHGARDYDRPRHHRKVDVEKYYKIVDVL